MLSVLLQAWLPTASHGQKAFGPTRRSGGVEPHMPEPMFAKIVALVPVRDEAHLLPSTLRALSHIADATIVLDDCSIDGSGELARSLAEECKVRIGLRVLAVGACALCAHAPERMHGRAGRARCAHAVVPSRRGRRAAVVGRRICPAKLFAAARQVRQ